MNDLNNRNPFLTVLEGRSSRSRSQQVCGEILKGTPALFCLSSGCSSFLCTLHISCVPNFLFQGYQSDWIRPTPRATSQCHHPPLKLRLQLVLFRGYEHSSCNIHILFFPRGEHISGPNKYLNSGWPCLVEQMNESKT